MRSTLLPRSLTSSSLVSQVETPISARVWASTRNASADETTTNGENRMAKYKLAFHRYQRNEHLVPDGTMVTLCGKDAKYMARFYAHERGMDARCRPTCPKCGDALMVLKASK